MTANEAKVCIQFFITKENPPQEIQGLMEQLLYSACDDEDFQGIIVEIEPNNMADLFTIFKSLCIVAEHFMRLSRKERIKLFVKTSDELPLAPDDEQRFRNLMKKSGLN